MITVQSPNYHTGMQSLPRPSASGSAPAAPSGAPAENGRRIDPLFCGPIELVDGNPSAVQPSYKIRAGGQEITFHVGHLTAKPVKFWEMAEEDYQTALSFLEPDIESLKRRYLVPPSEAEFARSLEENRKSPALMTYATITIAGQIVATIDNQGVVTTDDDVVSARLRGLLPDSINGTNGPDLAQARADAIAKLTGGRLNKSATAISQRAFESLPPLTPPQSTIDWAGLREEQERLQAQAQDLKQKRAEYLRQQTAVKHS
ncbi:hypothetical protein ACLE20_00195 [Rhizobium sp. YIM 134829]|uniref:hypothetical protein n=1 Tax=Rhizobium sp. YIM 134829 TaxID=3390453 RepID=UPI00397AD73B